MHDPSTLPKKKKQMHQKEVVFSLWHTNYPLLKKYKKKKPKEKKNHPLRNEKEKKNFIVAMFL